MFARLVRQRRRLALSAVLGALAGAFSQPAAILPGALIGLLLGLLLTALVLVVAPGFRWMALKALVIYVLVAALSNILVPLSDMKVMVIVGIVLFAVLPSQPWFLNHFRLQSLTKARAERPIRVSAEELWDRLFPAETDTHWDPALAAIKHGTRPDLFLYLYVGKDYHSGEQIPVRVFDVEKGYHFKLRDLSLPDIDDGGPATITSHVIEGDGSSSVLTIMQASWRLGAWSAFANWLDDHIGDHVDRIAAVLEDRQDWSVIGSHLRRYH